MTEFSRAGGEQACVKSLVLAALCLAAMSASAAVDLLVGGTDSPDPVATGSNLVYTLSITNIGNTAATGVRITNVLSSQVNFATVTTTRGSCSNVSGIVYCDWPTLNPSAGGRVTITVRPNTPGTITNSVGISANEADANEANNILTQLTIAVNRRTFVNTDFIQMDDVVANTANPYPSSINVSGLTAAVQKVTVTLNNASHNFPDDLDIMLVGPQGQHLMLMSDALTDLALVDIVMTFDDAASGPVPNTNAIASGSFQPVNYGSIGDIMPAPAPTGPHFLGFTPLSIFNGTDPNGLWRLFVYDDEPEWGGWIDGWSLTISTLAPMANIGVSVTDAPDPSLPGNIITYTTTVTNAGPAGAAGVWVTNRITTGLEVVSFSSSRGACTNGGGIVFCEIGAMDVGTVEQLIVQARPANGGTYSNRVEAGSERLDTQPANNVVTESTVVDLRCDLGIGLVSSRNPALLDQPLIYTLAVTNFGPDPVTGVRVVDELPSGLSLVNASSSQGACSNQAGIVTCELGTLANQARATILLTCRPTVLGPITNRVSVTGNQVDPNPDNNFAQDPNTVEPAADLLLTISDAPDPVPITQPLTYSIFLTNRGPNVASNIVISDVLPTNLVLVSVQSTHGVCTNAGNSVGCVIEQLPPGERPVVTIVVTCGTVGSVLNTATVTGQPADPNVGNNTATAGTLISSAADISVTKAGERPLVWQGDRVAYSLIVSNNGPSTGTAARLSDPLPPGSSFVSATASSGSCALQGATVLCTLGDLAPGAFATVSIVVGLGTSGTITNAANAFANEHDLNPANNAAIVVTTVLPKTATFSDTAPVVLPEQGPASTYPLTINVSGLTAAVHRVRVVFSNFSHTFPDDLDMLLVAPNGRSAVVMSDAGGSVAVSNLNLTLDDTALTSLPDSAPLDAGIFRPADYEPFLNEFPAPAPAGPYGSAFDTFANMDPNGIWKLYIIDDFAKDSGVLGGWSLEFSTRDPLVDLEVRTRMFPELVAVGSGITVALTVSNGGPGSASAVTLTNVYASNLIFSAANATQGTCTNEGGFVRCDLGVLAPGASAAAQISFAAAASGTETNVVRVGSHGLELNPANNSAITVYTAEHPPIIVTHPQDQSIPAGGTATFTVVVSGDQPLGYQWFHGQALIPDATNATLVVSNVQVELLGDYQFLATNRVGLALSAIAQLTFPRPPVVGMIADQTMQEDEALSVPLTVFDPDRFETLELSAVCDDTNLVPSTNFTFTVTGTNYALLIRPGTNQFGTNLITITATDSGGLTASRSFVLGVQAVNDYPFFIAALGDQVMDEDGVIELPFIIGDVETVDAALVIGHRSYNLMLAPHELMWNGGTTSNRLLHIATAPNQFGTAVIEIRIRDEAQVRTTNLFTLTVLPVEDPPTISEIDGGIIPEDGEFEVGFTAEDVESASENLRLRAESSDTNLFANDAFTFESTGATRKLRGRALPHQFGTSIITVFVEDEAGRSVSNAFEVAVTPVNDLPAISAIPPIETSSDQISQAVSFIIGDVETEAEALTLAGVSTNAALVLDTAIEFGGAGSNRTVRITPEPGQFGWTVARVEVTDGNGGVSVREFEVTVHQTNGPPVIALQPQHQMVSIGAPVSLRVVATGPGPLFYQWRRNDEDVPGETNAVLAIASAGGTNSGMYQVVVTNGEGVVGSDSVRLLVLEGTRIVSLTHTGNSAEITFTTAVDHQYYVEYQDDLGPEPWIALPGIDGSGEPMTVIDSTATGPRRFYRIRVEPAPLP